MMDRLLLCLTAALLLPQPVIANGQNGVWFLYPTRGETFHYKDTVNVTYQSHFDEPILYTFCSKDDGTIATKYQRNVKPGDNSALVYLDFSSDLSCWFNLRPNTSAGFGDNSDDFIVLPNALPNPTTLGLDTQSATPTPSDRPSETKKSAAASATEESADETTADPSSTTTTGTPTGGASATGGARATSTPASASGSGSGSGSGSATSADQSQGATDKDQDGAEADQGLTTGAKAGIGIGVAFGVLILAGIVALLLFRQRRQPANTSPPAAANTGTASPPMSASYGQAATAAATAGGYPAPGSASSWTDDGHGPKYYQGPQQQVYPYPNPPHPQPDQLLQYQYQQQQQLHQQHLDPPAPPSMQELNSVRSPVEMDGRYRAPELP